VIRVLLLFGSNADWQARTAAGQLADRLPAERFALHTAAMQAGGTRRRCATAVSAALCAGAATVSTVPRRFGLEVLGAPLLRRILREHRADLIHAWGVDAAVLAAAAAPHLPLAAELFDPGIGDADIRKLRSIRPAGRLGGRPLQGSHCSQSRGTPRDAGPLAIACSSQTVRRRLIERGIEPGATVVLRPGVDFAVINAARKSDLRHRLNLRPDDFVVITPGPARRGHGTLAAYWTVGVRSFVDPRVRLILPGPSPERRRIERLARGHGLGHLVRCPDESLSFADLVPVCDAMIAPPDGPMPTTAIAWAMAAGVPVLATANYATAELLSHNHNGLLIKPAPERQMAIRLAGMLEDRSNWKALAETARSQAYEVFSVRRCVDQHARLYDNLLSGTPPDQGITDPAYA